MSELRAGRGWVSLPMHDCERVHVVPLDDRREHVTDSGACWCCPTSDAITPQVLVHHSMDGREAHEDEELCDD